VVTMAPPSAGGGALLQMLAFTERADRAGELAEGWGAARTLHAQSHAMRLAFADRAVHYGDPDHVSVPLAGLLEPAYLDERWRSFSSGGARAVDGAGRPREISGAETYPAREGTETTHFSVTDADGNAVAVTTTVNDNFGAAFVAPGTGVVLNNEMDDFAAQPGVPNLFGLVGAEANAVAPGKRPLSSMTPTVVRDPSGRARLVLGAQGGPRITTSVYQAIVNRVRFGLSLPEAVAAPRVHQQWKPEEILYDRQAFPSDTLRELERRGWRLKPADSLGRLQAIEFFPETGRWWGASDPRTEGAAVAP
jgi:gamma-glutamyltranspeptidase/glutathione hydrolase